MTERTINLDATEVPALIEADAAFVEHGLDFRFPWECTLDDREAEMYVALVEACRAYAKWMSRMAEWQPIETAPKDGPSVILCDAHRNVGEAMYYDDGDGGWWWAGSNPSDYHDGRVDAPTHWQPLPTPPTSAAGS